MDSGDDTEEEEEAEIGREDDEEYYFTGNQGDDGGKPPAVSSRIRSKKASTSTKSTSSKSSASKSTTAKSTASASSAKSTSSISSNTTVAAAPISEDELIELVPRIADESLSDLRGYIAEMSKKERETWIKTNANVSMHELEREQNTIRNKRMIASLGLDDVGTALFEGPEKQRKKPKRAAKPSAEEDQADYEPPSPTSTPPAAPRPRPRPQRVKPNASSVVSDPSALNNEPSTSKPSSPTKPASVPVNSESAISNASPVDPISLAGNNPLLPPEPDEGFDLDMELEPLPPLLDDDLPLPSPPIAILPQPSSPGAGEDPITGDQGAGDQDAGDQDGEDNAVDDAEIDELQSSRATTVSPTSPALGILSSDELPFVDVPRNRDDWPDSLQNYGESLIKHEWSPRWTQLIYLFMDNERLSLWKNPVSCFVFIDLCAHLTHCSIFRQTDFQLKIVRGLWAGGSALAVKAGCHRRPIYLLSPYMNPNSGSGGGASIQSGGESAKTDG